MAAGDESTPGTEHSIVERRVSGTVLIQNFEVSEGSFEKISTEWEPGTDDTWVCECGDTFDSKTSARIHAVQAGKPKPGNVGSGVDIDD